VLDLKSYRKFIELYREIPFDYVRFEIQLTNNTIIGQSLSQISNSFEKHLFYPDKRIGGMKNPRTPIDRIYAITSREAINYKKNIYEQKRKVEEEKSERKKKKGEKQTKKGTNVVAEKNKTRKPRIKKNTKQVESTLIDLSDDNEGKKPVFILGP
jgi:hypothetical protein